MKTAGKVALVGIGLGALFYRPLMGLFFFGTDRAQKCGPLPAMLPAPDGSGRMVPVVSAAKQRGHYG